MKIGHISLTYRPVFGGQDTYIENLKKVFADLGHENTVYQALSLKHQIDRRGVHVARTLPIFGRYIKNFNWYYFNFFLRFIFRQKIKREDLLITHYALHYPAVAYHPNVIILSHGIEWHAANDQWDDAYRARNARRTFSLAKVVANDTEYLRFCGLKIEPGTRYFEEISPGKWFIPNCVDTDHFKKTAPLPDLAKLNPILVPRNIYYLRGIHLALEAFRILVERGNDKNHLVIVGNVVDRPYYQDLLVRVSEYGLEDRVHFRGHAAWEEMPALFSSSVCTLIPTIDCEGTSLSALESMACGTPVLATSVAGLKDLPCILAAPEPAAYAEALQDLLDRRDAVATLQEAAVRENFNMEIWSQAWKNVLSSSLIKA